MAHEKDEPKAPAIPSHEEQFEKGATELDGHVSSENPHEGRFADEDDECAGDCPFCE